MESTTFDPKEKKKRLLKAKIAVALQDEFGRVPKTEEIEQVFLLSRVMYKAISTVVFWLVIDGFWVDLEVCEAHLTHYGFPTAYASGGRRVDTRVVQVGLLVAPMAWWGDTAQPVLKAVTHTSLPQFVGHTPCKPHANRVGLVMACPSDTPHQEEAAHTS